MNDPKVRIIRKLEPLSDSDFKFWGKKDSWTLGEALFLLPGYKPQDEEFYFRDAMFVHFQEEYQLAISSIHAGKLTKKIKLAGQRRFIDSPENWIIWARHKSINISKSWELMLPIEERTNKIPNQDNKESNQCSISNPPWLIPDPNDPEPEQPWYTSARYFARQLVIDDSTLLTKRDLLVEKIAKSLDNVNIKKRGGKKPFNPDTVKKALSNIYFG